MTLNSFCQHCSNNILTQAIFVIRRKSFSLHVLYKTSHQYTAFSYGEKKHRSLYWQHVCFLQSLCVWIASEIARTKTVFCHLNPALNNPAPRPQVKRNQTISTGYIQNRQMISYISSLPRYHDSNSDNKATMATEQQAWIPLRYFKTFYGILNHDGGFFENHTMCLIFILH